MRSIFKYPVEVEKANIIQLPADAFILHCAWQGEGLKIWVLLDLDAPCVERTFRFYGTGFTLGPEVVSYLHTVLEGRFVWHLCEVQS